MREGQLGRASALPCSFKPDCGWEGARIEGYGRIWGNSLRGLPCLRGLCRPEPRGYAELALGCALPDCSLVEIERADMTENEVRCQKLVHPLKKGATDYLCTRPHFKDGWCRPHHPDTIAQKEKEQLRLSEIGKQNHKNPIEDAVLLLISNGYLVGKSPIL